MPTDDTPFTSANNYIFCSSRPPKVTICNGFKSLGNNSPSAKSPSKKKKNTTTKTSNSSRNNNNPFVCPRNTKELKMRIKKTVFKYHFRLSSVMSNIKESNLNKINEIRKQLNIWGTHRLHLLMRFNLSFFISTFYPKVSCNFAKGYHISPKAKSYEVDEM